MSLQEFTWQQFLVAAVVLSALWALGVWLIYWRPLSPGGLSGGRDKGRFDRKDALPHNWQDEVDELDGAGGADRFKASDDGLMGKPALEYGVSVLEADEFSFVPLKEHEERLERVEDGEIGEDLEPVEDKKPKEYADGWEANLPLDLREAKREIQIICRIMEREDGSKEDFFALFEAIRKDYPRLSGSELIGELNDFIREQVPFYLSDQELENLWV